MSSIEGDAQAILELLKLKGWTIGLAESCSGGRLVTALTNIPGSSEVVAGSIVAYQNRAKAHLLGVSSSILLANATVSEACALEMARGAQKAFDSEVACAITGSCGPTRIDASSQVGEVWVAFVLPDPLSSHSTFHTAHQIFSGHREQIAQTASEWALFLLSQLLGKHHAH